MIALKVTRNGQAPVIAGSDAMCVLNLMVNVLGKLGERSHGVYKLRDRVEASLRVGGTTNLGSRHRNEFIDWVNEDLEVGDRLTIELVEAGEAHDPIERRPITETRKLKLPLRRKFARRSRGAYIRQHKREAPRDYD